MTSRDRTVLMVVGLIAVVAAYWFLLLSPKREDLASAKDASAAAQTRLQTAQSAATAALDAKRRYARDYRVVARLGKAVPADDDVPSLVYDLETAAHASHIDFESIVLDGATAATAATPAATPAAQAGQIAQQTSNSTPNTAATGTTPGATTTPGTTTATAPVAAAQTAFAGLPPGASVGSAGLPTMPFSFKFSGSFFDLEKLLRKVDAFTKLQGRKIQVRGRLLTVDSVSLVGFPTITAEIKATAFLVPSAQGVTSGATAQAPATPPAATTATTPTTPGTAAPPVATATSIAGAGR